MSSQVRSVSVRMDADVASYVAKMRLAGRETDRAFGAAHSKVADFNRELGVSEQRLGRVNEQQKAVSTSQGRLNTRFRVGEQQLEAYNKRFDDLGVSLERTSDRLVDVDKRSEGVTRLGERANRSGSEIDKLSGRVGILLDLVFTVGPAFIPIGAAGLPVLAGLTTGALSVAGALGVTLLAVHGLGDGLKALDAYQLDKTPENLAKAQEALGKLGPDGAKFVMYLDDLEPKLKAIQDLTRAGLFPGVEHGIDSMLTRLPQVKLVAADIAGSLGHIAQEAGDNLAGPKFDAFFDYLEHRAGPILTGFAQAAGNVGEGFANVLVGLDSLTQGFSTGLLHMSQSFATWSRTLDTNTSFQGLLDYARENGPKVLDFIGAFVHDLASITEAAAPIGAVVLPILTDILDVVGAVADSDMGTPIFAGLAALSAYNRVLAITASLQKSAFVTGASGGRTMAAGGLIGGRFSGGVGAIKNIRDDMRILGNESVLAATGEAKLGVATRSVRENLPGLASGFARAAIPAAGFALVMSGAADKMGLANTATLAMMGSIGGPWGAAIGAGIGVVLDFKSANDDVNASIEKTKALASSSTASLAQYSAGLEQARKDYQAQRDFEVSAGTGQGASGFDDALKASITHPIQVAQIDFGNDPLDKLSSAYIALQNKIDATTAAEAGLGKALGMSIGPTDGSTRSVAELTNALAAAQPAMDALGITQDRLVELQQRQAHARWATTTPNLPSFINTQGLEGDLNVYDRAVDHIAAKTRWLNSSAGREHEVAKAIADIGSTASDAVSPVDALSQALSNLLDPKVNFREAAAQFSDALRELKSNLGKGSSLTTGQFPIGPVDSKNRQALDQLVTGLQQVLTTQAAVDPSAEHLTHTFQHQRQAIVDAAVAAGLHRKDVEKYLGTLNLAKGDVKSVVHLVVEQARANARKVLADFDAIPRNVRTEIRANGIPKTNSDIDALVAKYHLTEKQRTALISLRDDAAKAGIAQINQALNAVDGRNATATITTVHRDVHIGDARQPVARANGGLITGPGGPRDDSIHARLSNGEYVVNAYATARNLPLLHSINAQRFADGGLVGGHGRGDRDVVTWAVHHDKMTTMWDAVDGVTHGLAGMKKALAAEEKQRDQLLQQRNAVESSVRSQFASDPFATDGSSDAWHSTTGAGMDPNSVLRTNIKNAEQYQRLIRRLHRRHVSGAALGEVDTLAEAQALNGKSDSYLRNYQRLYGIDHRVANKAAETAGNLLVGKKLDAVQQEIHELRGDIKREEAHNRAEAKANAKKTGDHVGEALNNTADKARRDRRP